MSIATKLNSLNQVKSDIKNAVEAKGVDLTDIPFTQYATKIAEITTGDFPGYELKTGELCSLPAVTTNSADERVLAIPAGCIPICIKMDPTFKASSGKGETSTLVLDVRDNNNKEFYRACRNGSGQIYNNGTAYLCPLGAYNGDLELAKTCTKIRVRAHNSGMEYLYSDYQYGKVAVTMWLQKKTV